MFFLLRVLQQLNYILAQWNHFRHFCFVFAFLQIYLLISKTIREAKIPTSIIVGKFIFQSIRFLGCVNSMLLRVVSSSCLRRPRPTVSTASEQTRIVMREFLTLYPESEDSEPDADFLFWRKGKLSVILYFKITYPIPCASFRYRDSTSPCVAIEYHVPSWTYIRVRELL